MVKQLSIRSELEQLRAEVEALRAAKAPPSGTPPPAVSEEEEASPSIEQQIRNLAAMAEDYLEEAEDTVAAHPLAAVAGALALGIVIGRLTAR